MEDKHKDWDARVETLWTDLDKHSSESFLTAMANLVAELPDGDPVGLFEQASAHDSWGQPDIAVPLYQSALSKGLVTLRRRRATIQLASSLRNLGFPEKAVALLQVEQEKPSDELDGAVSAFLALALADLGREREALSLSLKAISVYLPRYNGSLFRYSDALNKKSKS